MNCSVFLTLGTAVLVALSSTAATLNIAPNVVSNSFSGSIAVTITGLNNAESVTVEKFIDLNQNGVVDANEPLVQHVRVRDGLWSTIAQVRNLNIPGDADGLTNGQITLRLSLADASEANRFSGQFRFRLSSPTSRFTPVEEPFTVLQAPFGQSITGTVFCTAQALPNAMVSLVTAGSDRQFVAGTVADGLGQFSLAAAPGRYRLFSFKPGNASVGQVSEAFQLSSNQKLEINLSNVPAPREISGLAQIQSSTQRIAGVQCTLTSVGGLATVGFTDAAGSFHIPVTASPWSMNWSAASLRQFGALGLQLPDMADTSSGNTSNNVDLPSATSLICGTLTDEAGTPISGTTLNAVEHESYLYFSTGFSNTNGAFTIGVRESFYWDVHPDQDALSKLGYLCLPTGVGLGSNELALVDLSARAINAHIRGQIIQSGGVPSKDLEISTLSFDGFSSRAFTDESGQFDLAVIGGDWMLTLHVEGAEPPLIAPSYMLVSLLDNTETTIMTPVVQSVTGGIVGRVTDASNNPLAQVTISAVAYADDFSYQVFGQTDDQGNFLLPVFNGTWSVAPADLAYLGFETPPPVATTIDHSTNSVIFVVQPSSPLRIVTQTIAVGFVGRPYSVQLEAGGGSKPYGWTLVSGSLPGLNLEGDGTLSGIPSQTGTNTFTVQLADNAANILSKSFSLITIFPTTLQIRKPQVGNQNQVHLKLSGKPNQNYVLEMASDPRSEIWIPLATNSNREGLITFTNSIDVAPIRFYRAREQ